MAAQKSNRKWQVLLYPYFGQLSPWDKTVYVTSYLFNAIYTFLDFSIFFLFFTFVLFNYKNLLF